MSQNLQANAKVIPSRVKRALLIILTFIFGVVCIDAIVERTSLVSLSPNKSVETLPQFDVAVDKDASMLVSNALTDAFVSYEHDLLDHFGAVWVAPHEIDTSIAYELFGVSPYHLETLTQTSQFLWNQHDDKGLMGLLGWVVQPESALTSSLASHSAYLEKQGWTPLASNSETTLSLIKEQSDRGGVSQESCYSWLLVELVSTGDATVALYSFY